MNRRKFMLQTLALTTAISSTKPSISNNHKSFELSESKKTRENPPNILFIMTDQLRYDCIAANGNKIIHTPNLDRLANQSANFSSAFVQSPVCTPSRACFFTGRYAHAHKNRVNYTSLDEKETLLPKYLQNAGYHTALIGKTHLYYNYPPTALEASRTGFEFVELHDGVHSTDPYSAYVEWRMKIDPMKETYYRELARNIPKLRANLSPKDNPFRSAIKQEFTDTSWTGLVTRQYLKKFATFNKPFFLFSSFWKPHSPFEVPIPFDSMYNEIEIPLPKKEIRENILNLPPALARLILRDEYRNRKPVYNMDPNQLLWIYRSYYGAISHIDQEVGLILKTLEESGMADNTIILFTSDHGDQLLEHGLMGKNVFYESSVRIPLMISHPKTIMPGNYNELVMSIDVLPTLFELIGIPEPYNCQGQSLLPLITGSGQTFKSRDCVFSENVMPEVFANIFNFEKNKGVMGVRHPDGKMVRTKRWKFNYYPQGYQELYDLENDPSEFNNLANEPEYRKVVEEMKGHILDWLITASETDQIAPRWLI
jgi:arylsulfatase A-like enzyme